MSQTKKWLTRITLAVLAAVLSASVAVAFPKSLETVNLAESSQISNVNSQQLLQQGRELFQTEKFSEAVTVWQKAVSGFEAAGDKANLAQVYNLLSLGYQELGKLREAQDAIASSLSLLQSKENSVSSTDRLSILAQALNTQGHLQLALGKAEQALENWQKAAAIYSQIQDTEGIIGSQLNQAQALQYLGLYRRAKKTLEQLESSLNTQANSPIKVTGLRSLGNALRVIGDLEKSRTVLQQSLSIAQDIRSKEAISAVYFSLGNVARDFAKSATELEDTSTAKTETETALNAYQEAIKTSVSPKLRVQAQLNQLSLLVDNKQFAEAEVLRSQIQLNELPASRRTIYALINLAQSLTKLGLGTGNWESVNVKNSSHSSITEILVKAVQQAKTLQDGQAESYALGNLGGIYELTGQNQESFNLTQQALILAQATNASDIAYRWQWQLGRLLKAQGHKKEAIAAYTTAVETLESLRSDLVAINPENPDVQFSFRESVEPVYRELVDLLLATKGETSQENLTQARQVIESLQLAELDNFFQEACLDAKPVQIDKVDANAAVIYPIILPEKLGIILALPKSSLRYYATVKPQSEIENLLNELQQDLGRITANNQQVLRLSEEVYNWIIRPAEADLKQSNVQTLVFVLDGLLRNIPMGALYDGKQYLVEKYSIALTPGLQLLPAQPLVRNQTRVLTAGLSEARGGFSALPNVERELNEIEKQVNSQELLNQQFTENNLQKAIESVPFPVVHIASHGQFSSQAQKTFILTWDGEINVKELDSLLRRREQEESHPIELLVFSACETAEGDSRATLGLAGIAVRAGARSTLATLWRVSDESTATLMVRFYQELVKENVTKAEALRRAQLSLLQERRYRNPYFWAPYVLVGNWR